MNNFCTITTNSHLYKAFALADSLVQSNGLLHILVVDAYENIQPPNNAILYPLSIIQDELAQKLIRKYTAHSDKLRWSMKAAFLSYLLTDFNKVIYIDNDVYFYNDASFLFDELTNNNVLLTPHFYSANPLREQNWLEANFRVGLYNAGFFGVNKNAKDVLKWWMQCCLYNIKQSYWRGLFDDQKYLDLIPILFDQVKVLKHKGCNAAGWNYRNYNITKQGEQFQLNGHDLVFIHFANLSMDEFSNPNNTLHAPYLSYINHLKTYNHLFSYRKKINLYQIKSLIYYMKWRFSRLFNY